MFFSLADMPRHATQKAKTTGQVPVHVAIIPDGNRRWARERGLPTWKGHEKAANENNLRQFVQAAKKLGIKHLSVWGFSTENWRRSPAELKKLFQIFLKLAKDAQEEFVKEKIRFRHIGRKDRLPRKLMRELEKLEQLTSNYNDTQLNLFLDYGGKHDILQAVNKALSLGKKRVSEREFEKLLLTNGIPEPDLIIRTGKEKRLSGFLLYQAAYTELYFTNKHFPDFSPQDLRRAVQNFMKRKRNFGK
ncbi:di-trans,poly-cis-decaprenylcistransferase [Candidatus Pacearchaeota archaeon]|nr:MAG: di-trans,poly-cis-decaprenylcistransferase [Candidatus Pacearchaeota archaeon]